MSTLSKKLMRSGPKMHEYKMMLTLTESLQDHEVVPDDFVHVVWIYHAPVSFQRRIALSDDLLHECGLSVRLGKEYFWYRS